MNINYQNLPNYFYIKNPKENGSLLWDKFYNHAISKDNMYFSPISYGIDGEIEFISFMTLEGYIKSLKNNSIPVEVKLK